MLNAVTKDDKKKYKVEICHIGRIVTKELSLAEIKNICKKRKLFCVNYVGMNEEEKKAIQEEVSSSLEECCPNRLPILAIVCASISILAVIIGFIIP